MKRTLCLAALLASLLAATDAAAQGCSDPRTRRELTRVQQELKALGASCAEAARADLDGDGRADAVLHLTFEAAGGGNNWSSWLYVLPGNASAPLLEEPDETRGTIDSITVVGREIRVRTVEYREGDGHCCPSGRGTYALRMDGARLVRVRAR